MAVSVSLALVVASGLVISSTPTPTLPGPVTLVGPPPAEMTTEDGLVVVKPSVVDLNFLSRNPEDANPNDGTDSDGNNDERDDLGESDDGDSPDLDDGNSPDLDDDGDD